MNSEIKYSKKLIAFIDILGFRELLKDPNNLNLLVDQLTNIKKVFDARSSQVDRFLKYDVIQFSDSIIISIDIKDVFDINLALEKISLQICSSMMDSRIVVRGAITYGDFYSKDNMLISPAFAEAYEIEGNVAKYPRIVISDSLLSLLDKPEMYHLVMGSKQQILDWHTIKDSDGVSCLHYLRQALHLDGISSLRIRTREDFFKPDPEMVERLERFRRYQALIEMNLKKFKNSPSIFEKYVWLANYHNNFILSIEDDWLKTCVIDKNFLVHHNVSEQFSGLQKHLYKIKLRLIKIYKNLKPYNA